MTADHEPGRAPERVNKPATNAAPTTSWSNKAVKKGSKGKSRKAKAEVAEPLASREGSAVAIPTSARAQQASKVLATPRSSRQSPAAPEISRPGSEKKETPLQLEPPAPKPSVLRAEAAEGVAGKTASSKAGASVASLGGGEFEAAAENLAKLVDQGRRVLAAAMSASDLNETRSELAVNVADATKTLGLVAEYWMMQPERVAKAQADLISGLGDIWSQNSPSIFRRGGGPNSSAGPFRQAFRFSGLEQQSVFRLLAPDLCPDHELGE